MFMTWDIRYLSDTHIWLVQVLFSSYIYITVLLLLLLLSSLSLYYYYYYHYYYHYRCSNFSSANTHVHTHTYIYILYVFIYSYIYISMYIYIYVDMEIISPGTTSAWASPVWLWPVPWQSSAVLWSLWRCCGVAGCWRQSRRCQRRDWRLMGLFWGYEHMGMDQYLLMPFLVGWTSIYQLFWCSPGVQGFDTLPYDTWCLLEIFLLGMRWL